MNHAPVQTSHAHVFRTLNTCIEVSMDGEKGYAIAAADVRDPMLKGVLQSYSSQRADFVRRLQLAVEGLGGFPENQGTARGAVHRGVLAARRALEGRTDGVVLEECVRGERAAIASLDQAFTTTPLDTLATELRALLVDQRAATVLACEDLVRRATRH